MAANVTFALSEDSASVELSGFDEPPTVKDVVQAAMKASGLNPEAADNLSFIQNGETVSADTPAQEGAEVTAAGNVANG